MHASNAAETLRRWTAEARYAAVPMAAATAAAAASIRGRRGEGTVRRGPDVARSARRPQVEILAENPYIFCLISRLDPLERLPCDGLVLQRPARCPAAGRSEAENRRKIDLPAEARNVPSRPLMNVTITG